MEDLHEWSAKQIFEQIIGPVQDWWHHHGILYPWSPPTAGAQYLPDSYAVWVSEVMLQQTRVETVIPYYKAWIQRWANLTQLATATEEQVLKQWEGLGYYSRALNMLKCAQQCVYEQKVRTLPLSVAQLQNLPGIGPYIAAAVASISGNKPVLALDTNVQRIFSRLYQQQPALAIHKLWQQKYSNALEYCSWRGAANIGLIQLGQQICKAVTKQTGPLCSCCPLENICPAVLRENWAKFPAPRVYQQYQRQTQRLVLYAEGKILLFRKRSGALRLLWRFPEIAWVIGLQLPETKYLGSFDHAYLKIREKVEVYLYYSTRSCGEWNEKLWNEKFLQHGDNCEWLWTEDIFAQTLAGPYRKFWNKLGMDERIATATCEELAGNRVNIP